MRKLKSCGLVLFTRSEPVQFLLMRHADRLDLPKGHVDPGESDLACALREFEEETGLRRDQIELDPVFRFSEVYHPPRKRYGEPVEKQLIVFLATVDRPVPIALTEHIGYDWIPWKPPHDIQANTINPLLVEVERHFQRNLPSASSP